MDQKHWPAQVPSTENVHLRPFIGICGFGWRLGPPAWPPPPGTPLVWSNFSAKSSTRTSFKCSKCSRRRIFACRICEKNQHNVDEIEQSAMKYLNLFVFGHTFLFFLVVLNTTDHVSTEIMHGSWFLRHTVNRSHDRRDHCSMGNAYFPPWGFGFGPPPK